MLITGRDVFKIVYSLSILLHILCWVVQYFKFGAINISYLIISMTTISSMTMILVLTQKEKKNDR